MIFYVPGKTTLSVTYDSSDSASVSSASSYYERRWTVDNGPTTTMDSLRNDARRSPSLSSGSGRAGVYVRSSLVDVRLHSVNRATSGSDAFTPLPLSALGTEYVAIGHPDYRSSRSELLVVSTAARTRVDIRLGSQTVEYKDKTYTSGQVISVLLDRLRSFHLTVDAQDLAGVRVYSDAAVAVIESTRRSGAHSALQLSPVKSWGRDFVISRFPGSRGDRLRCTSASTSRDGRVNGQSFSGFLFQVVLLDREVRFTFDAPVQCANFGDSGTTTALLVVPVAQYLSGERRTSVLEAGGGSVFNTYALLSVDSRQRTNVRLDDRPIAESAWRQVNGMVSS